MEPAAGWRVDRGGDVAGEDDALAVGGGVGVGGGGGGQEGGGVGVAGVVVDVVAGSLFGDAAEVHDGDGVADVPDDFEVVGDEQVGQAEVGLEVGEEVEDLGLDGDVEGGDGFVADDELGAQGQGAGDADALALAAGEFGGEPVVVLGVEADAGHQVLDGFLALVAGGGLVDGEGVADDRADPAAGVEGAVGVLEDHLDLAAERLHGAAGQVGDVAALEVDLA